MFFSKRAWINVHEKFYLNLIIVVAPLLNFLAGISFDLYAPSMPAIAREFNTSLVAVKNTITITMAGFAIGSLILGVLIDRYGRRTIIVPSLFLYIIVSLIAVKVTSIQQLLAIRFFQGAFTAAAGIGARAMVTDYFSGKRFFIAILYMSIAYGFGLVIGPFFGGYLQYHFGWQANFYAYALIAAIIELIIILFIHESLSHQVEESLWQTTKFYLPIVSHRIFLAGTLILGLVLVEQLIYPTVGVFIVQNTLQYSPVTYGNTALLVGLSYLVGTLMNRIMLEFLSANTLVTIGFSIMLFSVSTLFLFGASVGLNLWTLLIPIIIFNLGLGYIFGNIVAICLGLFPKNAGMNTAVQSCLFMLLSSVGIFFISYLNIVDLWHVALVYLVLLILQVTAFASMQRKGI